MAARAADLQDAVERRDQWLERAQEQAPDERAAALVTLAEMQMRRGQDEAALQTLEQLDASGDMNSRGLELMARLYQKLGKGERVRELAPRLRSAKELPEAQVNEILAQAQLEDVRAAGETHDAARARHGLVGRAARRCAGCRRQSSAYARAAMACNEHGEAEKALRELIDASGDAAAIRLYGDLVLADPLGPLDRAETWLRKKPDDPELLATCGKLCLRADLIGKARSYLEASIARRPNSETQPAARRPARAAG